MMKKTIKTIFFLTVIFLGVSDGLAQKEEKRAKRPGKENEPTKIEFFIFVVNVSNIDGARQSFDANFYVYLSWKDPSLVKKGETLRNIPLGKIWNPQIVLENQGGFLPESLPQVAQVLKDGTVIYRQRYVGPLYQPLDFSQFPLDKHVFRISMVSVAYGENELEFIPTKMGPEDVGGGISKNLSLPDWKILRYEAKPHSFEASKGIKTEGFIFEFEAERFFIYYFWQLVLPMTFIVGMSWSAFWINPAKTAAQLGVAGSSMVSLIAYRFVMSNLVPKLPYMTRMDHFIFGTMFLVFLSLIEIIFTSMFVRKKHKPLAIKLDKFSRVTFPLIYLLILIRLLFL